MSEEIINVNLSELFVEIIKLYNIYCGLDSMDEEMEREYSLTSSKIYHKFIKDRKISVIIKRFGNECIDGQGFRFRNDVFIRCNVLQKLKLRESEIKAGYIYIFCVPEEKAESEELSLLERYYLDNFKIAAVDAVRGYIRKYIAGLYDCDDIYITDSFGPGFYGMQLEEIYSLAKLTDYNKLGIYFINGSIMNPPKSSVGIYMVLTEDKGSEISDCLSCIGGKSGCQLCGKNKRIKIRNGEE